MSLPSHAGHTTGQPGNRHASHGASHGATHSVPEWDGGNIIEIEGLWTKFGDHVVHAGVSLTVKKGDILSLVGGSGSGKTTMLRQMLGLETPHRKAVMGRGGRSYLAMLRIG